MEPTELNDQDKWCIPNIDQNVLIDDFVVSMDNTVVCVSAEELALGLAKESYKMLE